MLIHVFRNDYFSANKMSNKGSEEICCTYCSKYFMIDLVSFQRVIGNMFNDQLKFKHEKDVIVMSIYSRGNMYEFIVYFVK